MNNEPFLNNTRNGDYTTAEQYANIIDDINKNKNLSTYEYPPKTRFLSLKKLIKGSLNVIFAYQHKFNNAVFSAINSLAKDSQRLQNEQSNIVLNQEQSIERLETKLEDLQVKLAESNSKIYEQHIKLQDAFDQLEKAGIGCITGDERLYWGKKSSSQAGEDSIIEFVIGTLHLAIEECEYIDLGANHPYYLSNTNYFYQKGAKGILVEANPNLIKDLKFYRNRDIVLNRFVSSKSGETIEFYILNIDGLSTSDYESVQNFIKENENVKIVDKVTVESITVNEIMDKYLGHAPMILNIDIEGMELKILHDIDFEKYRPFIIIVEMIPYKKSLVIEQKNQEILDFMEKAGYTEYAFSGINSIFIDKSKVDDYRK